MHVLVRPRAGGKQVLQCLRDPSRPEEVHLDRAVEGRVEGHGGGGVDDEIAPGQGLSSLIVEPEPVPADVPGDHRDPLGDQRVERGVAPGLRPHDGPGGYYAAFIRDLDGNRIEAVTFV